MGFDKCMMPCIHDYSVMQNSFTALKIPCDLSFSPAETTDLFAFSIVLPSPECHVVEIIQCVVF